MIRHGPGGIRWAGGPAVCALAAAVDGSLRRHGGVSGGAGPALGADARAGRGPLEPRHLAHDRQRLRAMLQVVWPLRAEGSRGRQRSRRRCRLQPHAPLISQLVFV